MGETDLGKWRSCKYAPDGGGKQSIFQEKVGPPHFSSTFEKTVCLELESLSIINYLKKEVHSCESGV